MILNRFHLILPSNLEDHIDSVSLDMMSEILANATGTMELIRNVALEKEDRNARNAREYAKSSHDISVNPVLI